MKNNLNVVIGSDDPGIFNSNLMNEYNICREKIGLCEQEMNILFQNSDRLYFNRQTL